MKGHSIGMEASSALAHRLMGIQRYISQLSAAIAELSVAEPGLDLELIYRISRFRKYHLRPDLALDYRWYWPLPGLGARHYDLVHALDTTLPWPLPPRLVCTVHDLFTLVNKEPDTPGAREKCLRSLRYVTSHCDAIIVPSKTTRADLEEHTAYSGDRILVVPLGVDDKFFSTSLEISGSSFQGASDTKPYILAYSGGRKNFLRIVQAFMKAGLVDDYRIHAIGSIDPATRKFVNDHGLSEQVVELGFIDDDDMPRLYSDASMLCFPSLYEGFGLPVLEGMAAGVPVVTSGISATGEVGGDHAILVDPYSVEEISRGMVRALSRGDDALRKAREYAREYSWHRTAQQTWAVYRSILDF